MKCNISLKTAIFILLLVLSAVAQMDEAQLEAEKEARIRERAEQYARSRDVDAQDRIIDPQQYFIGPGDELTIFFYGGYTRENRILITPEGSALIPDFGEIYLGQITLKEAKEKILNALGRRYRNVEISVTLSKLRKLKVSVDGEVNFPGVYTVTSMDRITEAIQLAGGLTEGGSERNIRVIRNGEVREADLLSFARAGDEDANPYLLEGDKIFVPPRRTNIGLVEIYGAVKLPGEYEFVRGETAHDLIMLAGGTTLDANLNSASLVRFDDESDSNITINLHLKEILDDPSSSLNIELMPDDRVFIRSIPDYHRKAQVKIEGEVRYPGVYPIKEDTTTLTEVIDWAGGFTEDASLAEARMYRSGYEAIRDTELDRQIKLSIDKLSDIEREYLLLKSDPDQGRVSIDFEELFAHPDTSLDVALKDGDRIMIPRKSLTVRIMGRVLKPGLLTFREGAEVDYYVSKAGGFTKSADKGKIRVIKGATGSIVKPSSKISIEVGDEILVPEKKDTDWWEVAKDVGLFLANLATVYVVIDQIIE
jgi:protein involved in polysaccharide export with SLBB domain